MKALNKNNQTALHYAARDGFARWAASGVRASDSDSVDSISVDRFAW